MSPLTRSLSLALLLLTLCLGLVLAMQWWQQRKSVRLQRDFAAAKQAQQARATALGRSLKVESATRKGTRVVLLPPVASAT